MSIFREIPPTAGWPIKIRDLILPLLPGQKTGLLEEDFKEYLGLPYCRLTYSGTAAFYIILEALKSISPKKTVVIPGVVCPLVALAVKRAGLKLAVCDINSEDFGYEPDKLSLLCSQNRDILAVLAVHLAGLPVDIDAIKNASGDKGIFIVEDCAQSLGAEYKDRKTGTLGDFAFFSLCRGKGLSIYEGGMAAAGTSRYGSLLEDNFKRFANEDYLSEGIKILELFAYWLFYRPALFWFAFRAPQIYWQKRKNPVRAMAEYFTPAFPLHAVSGFRQAVGHRQFKDLQKNINLQREKAQEYIHALRDFPAVSPITENRGSKGTYPYLTVTFKEPGERAKLKERLSASGLGVSLVYLSAITDYAYLTGIVPHEELARSRLRLQNSITLSTSIFIKKNEMRSLIKLIKKG